MTAEFFRYSYLNVYLLFSLPLFSIWECPTICLYLEALSVPFTSFSSFQKPNVTFNLFQRHLNCQVVFILWIFKKAPGILFCFLFLFVCVLRRACLFGLGWDLCPVASATFSPVLAVFRESPFPLQDTVHSVLCPINSEFWSWLPSALSPLKCFSVLPQPPGLVTHDQVST